MSFMSESQMHKAYGFTQAESWVNQASNVILYDIKRVCREILDDMDAPLSIRVDVTDLAIAIDSKMGNRLDTVLNPNDIVNFTEAFTELYDKTAQCRMPVPSWYLTMAKIKRNIDTLYKRWIRR